MHGIALSDARVGTTGVVASVDLPDEVSHHLAHLGFLPGAGVEVLRRAPAGDPRVYRIDGVEVGLRNETARHIFLEVVGKALELNGEDTVGAERSDEAEADARATLSSVSGFADAGKLQRSFASLRMTTNQGTELAEAAR